ncbi:DUF6057 family protein [uncultured Parabacteroides sp.]|uniref:DUF6057 family protein n=1 Tax=uncultured Parabacteroides sp. TaxID=512312 RepID=UPI002629557C|nr:DUF6057 family protein [uncultured Parabacteroides sp.]
MKKYRGGALGVIVFVFLFIFLRVFSEYHFYCVEQNQLFLLTRFFIVDELARPGGLAMVLSGWLVQFFIIPNAGAMITAALLTSLGILLQAILRRIDLRGHGILWAWLPILSLLFVQWDFNYRLQGTVAFGMMLLVLYLVLGIRKFIPRLITSVLSSLLLFGLAGPVSLLFALSMVGYEAMSRTSRWYYSVVLPTMVLILGGLCVRYSVIGEYRFAFLPDSYYYFRLIPDKVIYFSWIAFFAALAITCLCKNREPWVGKKRLALDVSQLVILGLVFWKGFGLYGEQGAYRLKMMDYFTRTEQWDRILESCKEPVTNPLYLCYQNMALARKGILADEAFKYAQHGPRGLMVAWNKSTTLSALLSDVYFTMGNVAAAQEMAFESNIGALCGGNPRMMQRLVQTNLIYGAYPVAEKYIAVLENTFYYKDWAKAQRKFLYNDEAVEADPVLGNMRKNLLSENHLSQVDGFDTDLIRLAEQNPSNKAALHYVGVFYLLAKDVTHFKKLVETYYGTDLLPSLPLAFQEAVIILSEKDPDYWKRFGVSESIAGRFADYKRQVLAGRNNSSALPGLMYRSYGDTYWYYYMFK